VRVRRVRRCGARLHKACCAAHDEVPLGITIHDGGDG
jgi:hypothetical protein